MRKYSFAEIQKMRDGLREFYSFAHRDGRWNYRDDPPIIEDQLRTHVLNGSDPEEIHAAGQQAMADWSEKESKKGREYMLTRT